MELINQENKRLFGDDYLRILISELRRSGKIASGRLERSLDYRLKDEKTAVNIVFEGEDYFKYVDEGRKPGTWPNIRAISNWANTRGIPQKAVFPIARSIYKFGIKPTNISEKTERASLDGQPMQRLEDGIAENVEEEVLEILETLNNK